HAYAPVYNDQASSPSRTLSLHDALPILAEGRAIVDAARKNKRIVQTGSQQRSASNFRLACELVRSGYIGTVKEVKVGNCWRNARSEEHTSELQSRRDLVCRLLLEKKKRA